MYACISDIAFCRPVEDDLFTYSNNIRVLCTIMAVLILVLVAATYADIPHLRDLAAKLDNPIFVGSAAGASHITSQDTEYNSTLKDQFSLITPENGCKWTATEPQEGKFNFTECDVVFNYSRQYNQAFRGHNLCWGVHNPEWYTTTDPVVI
jgi:GH35 family endo-1,4-beta-xylanase